MIRLHMVQMFYNPAYHTVPIDYLAEPYFSFDEKNYLGNLRVTVPTINNFLLEHKESYIRHLKVKVESIVNWSHEQGAQILIFPEYSIPFQILKDIQPKAKAYSMLIVAGTHRISQEAMSIYSELGGNISSYSGCAVSPIFFPDGTLGIAPKLSKSMWEQDLTTPKNNIRTFESKINDTCIKLVVMPCIDAIRLDLLGELVDKEKLPLLIICPSLSPSVEPFEKIGSILSRYEIPFVYVSGSLFGRTSLNIPQSWKEYLGGTPPPYRLDAIPEKIEGILEVDIDPNNFFLKKGTITTLPPCNHPCLFPIVYTRGDRAEWIAGFSGFSTELITWLSDSTDIDGAKNCVDEFEYAYGSNFPDLIRTKLNFLRHSLIPFYDGNIESIKSALKLIKLEEENTEVFFAKGVNKALDLLYKFLPDADPESVDIISNYIKTLKKQQQSLPKPPAMYEPAVSKRESLVYSGEVDLIEAFQDRGHELEDVIHPFIRSTKKICIITGAIGVGKSDFINWIFRKSLIDWKTVKIQIPKGARFSRVVTEIAHQLGMVVNPDLVDRANDKMFKKISRTILEEFFNGSKRALILDDLYQILRDRNARDYKQITLFLQEATSTQVSFGAKIFLLSSIWVAKDWLNLPHLFHLRLRSIKDKYMKRIITYHMRSMGLVQDEESSEIPQELLDIVRGHPLSAKLVVEVLRSINSDWDQLINKLKGITEHLARRLLEHVQLSPQKESLIQRLSVFRLPVRKDMLLQLEPSLEDTLKDLECGCVLDFDGETYEMHEAIKRFYYAKILFSEKENYHKFAVRYYQQIYKKLSTKVPDVLAELVYHSTLTGEIGIDIQLFLSFVAEIKQTAREIYKSAKNSQDYQKALSMFRKVAEITPDDPATLAYIGRCYGRFQQWHDCDREFKNAIKVAEKTKDPTGWLYRDWGHIKARFWRFEEAKEHLGEADKMHPDDPGTKSALAYIAWKEGDYGEARRLFEGANNLNRTHQYTLKHYSIFLENTGNENDRVYANQLKQKLKELEEELYTPPAEFEIEEEYDD